MLRPTKLRPVVFLGLVLAGPATASDVRVDQIHVKNNSVGDAAVIIEYDCDKDNNGSIEKNEEYACRIGYMNMTGNQNIPAGQDGMIGKSDIEGKIPNGTRIGLKISNTAGQQCQDRHPPNGDNVIYDTTANHRIQFKITGDAISGLSCHFQKD